jgi:YVTN family beta-propeller protein
MTKNKSVKSCVVGIIFMCALVSTASTTAQADSVDATITVGTTPYNVAINPSGTFAYVSNYGSDTVSKIDLATNTVAATIIVGDGPWGLAINPLGTFAYVSNDQNGTVSKIDLATNTVVTTITVEQWPWYVGINPAGTFAYVTNRSNNIVSKIDLATNAVTSFTIPNPSCVLNQGFPCNSNFGVAFNSDATFAYVSGPDKGTVAKINLNDNSVVNTITVGSSPRGLAINPSGTFAYVSNYASNNVSKIDLATNTVVATIPVGSLPYGVAIDPAGTFAYVSNRGTTGPGSVSKIDLATNTVAATITVGSLPYGVAINPSGTFVLVVNRGSTGPGSVSKIAIAEPAPNAPGASTVVVGEESATITVSPPTSGPSPTSYVVTAAPGGKTCTVTVPALSCTITDLTAGTAYTFTTVAKTASGSSPAGLASASATALPKVSAPTSTVPAGTSSTVPAGTTVSVPAGYTPSWDVEPLTDSETDANTVGYMPTTAPGKIIITDEFGFMLDNKNGIKPNLRMKNYAGKIKMTISATYKDGAKTKKYKCAYAPFGSTKTAKTAKWKWYTPKKACILPAPLVAAVRANTATLSATGTWTRQWLTTGKKVRTDKTKIKPRKMKYTVKAKPAGI